MSNKEVNQFQTKAATSSSNAMATLSTNTMTVPSTCYLVRPISSAMIPAQQDKTRPLVPLSHSENLLVLRRRKTRMLPNPKKAHSIEMKIMEIRNEYFKSYHMGADLEKHALCSKLISQDAPINTKYKELDFEALLKKNMIKFRLDCLSHALGIHEKYALNLIRPNKPQFWRTVKFTSSLWKTYMENVNGSIDILKQMGYNEELMDGLSFPVGILPDVEHVKELSADLYLAKIETDDIVNNRHPYFEIESFLPDQKKMEELSSPWKKPQNIYLSTGKEFETSDNSDSEYEDAKDGLSNEDDTNSQILSPTALKEEALSPPTACYVCGTSDVEWYCSNCKQDFCVKCEPIFHKSLIRQSHRRQKKRNDASVLGKSVQDETSVQRKHENVLPSKPLPASRPEKDGNKKAPIPKPRKRIPSKTSSTSSSLNLDGLKSSVLVHTSTPEKLPPTLHKKSGIQSPTQFIKPKVPQQPSLQEREILRPPVVSKYEPLKEPYKLILMPREENVYESLKEEENHIYETLDDEKPDPPPLPPKQNSLQKATFQVQQGVTTCPSCYCLNNPDALSCVACRTSLHKQPSLNRKPNHEEQGVIHYPKQSSIQLEQRNTYFQKSVENPMYFYSPSHAVFTTTGEAKEKPVIKEVSSPDLFSKVMKPQWECQFCTFLNPVDKKICEVCAKTKTINAKVVQPDLTPPDNTGVTEPQSTVKKLQEEEFKSYPCLPFSLPRSIVEQLQRNEEDLLLQEQSGERKYPEAQNHDQCFSSSLSSYPSVFTSYGEDENQKLVQLPIEANVRVKVSVDKEIKESREDGQEFVKKMKEAEKLGFSPEELNIAYNLSIEDPEGPIHWLHTKWFDRIHQVMIKFTNASKEENIGNVSPEEARQALIERTGVVEDAVKLCVEERSKGLQEVMNSGFYPKTDCILALDKHDGDVSKGIQELRIKSFQPLLQRVWDSCLTDATDGDREWQHCRQPDRQLSDSPSDDLFEDLVSKKEFDKDRRIRVMLAEKNFCSWGRAETAIRLIDMDFSVSDSIEAAKAYGDLERSLQFLHRECILCASEKPESQMVTMLNCQCRFCRDCVSKHFTLVIQEQNIMRLICPQCDQPNNLDDDLVATEYFNHLDIMMRGIISKQTHDLFQQKLRDRTLMKEPNFRWCSHCSSGFINEQPQVIKMACPNCRKYTCFRCKKQWEDQHEGITCEQFAAWKEANDPEVQANGLAAHLKQNGIECPQCKFRYDLAKGGCMHFKCNQCSHEFCSGCYKPFKQGNNCTVSENCVRSGLHAHHPRDCLFYLRDREPEELKKLLDDNNVEYNTEPPGGQAAGVENQAFQEEEGEAQGEAAAANAGHCKVIEQRETANGLKDDECGREILPGFAGLCRTHFKEYLVERINANLIDPVEIFTIQDLEAVLRRNYKEPPKRKAREKGPPYRERLLQFVKAQLPLPKRPPRRRVLNEDPIAEDEIHLILDEEERDGALADREDIRVGNSDGESNDGYNSDGDDSDIFDFGSDES